MRRWLHGRVIQIRRQLGARCNGGAPSLDTACSLDAGDRRDQVVAGEVVRGGERYALLVVRILLGDGRQAEWTPGGDPAKGTGASADLALDDVAILHARHRSVDAS